MRGIENTLTSYLKGNGKKISRESVHEWIADDTDLLVQSILKVVDKELDYSAESLSIDKIEELFHMLHTSLEEGVLDRQYLVRRLYKMDAKIERLKEEKKNRQSKKASLKLNSVRNKIHSVIRQIDEKENKQYDLMDYLVNDIKNINYLEYTFSRIPNVINIRDKEEKSLFLNSFYAYINSLEGEDKKEKLYYHNVLSLMLAQKNLCLTEKEKKEIFNTIYKTINSFTRNKETTKKNLIAIRELKSLVSFLKQDMRRNDNVEKIAYKYNIPVFFKTDLLEQIHFTEMDSNNRYLVDDYVITIDDQDVVEIDDGLSCQKLDNGNTLLGVHIASVLGYFPYESKIVQEALFRTKSIYLPAKYQQVEDDYQRVIPMFPYSFSANKGSLIKGVPRLARSYYFEIDREGNIVDERFLKTIVVNRRKMTYQEVDTIIEHGCDSKEVDSTIHLLEELCEILDKHYQVDSSYEELKESTSDYTNLRVKNTGAQKIVYQTMLLTGNRVAESFSNNGYPCLYRVHQKNQTNTQGIKERLDILIKKCKKNQYQKLYQLVDGLYPKGWYSMSGSHEGLGLDHYCHCTSNLRRSADVVMEHALEVCQDKKPIDQELVLLEKEIQTQANMINAKEEPIDWFVKEYKRNYARKR